MKNKITSLLEHYGYKYTDPAIEKILCTWKESKSWLISAMRKHRNWNENELCILLNSEMKREINKVGIEAFVNWALSKDATVVSFAPSHLQGRRFNYPFFIDDVYRFFYTLKGYYSRTVDDCFISFAKSVFPDISFHVGEKTTRFVNKIMKYIGFDKLDDYNREFAAYADAISPTTIKRKTIVSVNPLDYLTMSFGNSWSSCHTIDKKNIRNMPDGYHGMYSSGTMSYMLDESSVVVYTIDEKYDGTDFWAQPKITRQMYHYGHDGVLVQGRLYPSNNGGDEYEYTEYRQIIQEIFAQIYDLPNFWTIKKGPQSIREYVCSEGAHYRDYECFECCTVSLNKSIENHDRVKIGHLSICIHCGNEHDISSTICCCDSNRCSSCGDIIDEDDAFCIDGEWYCENCVFYCEDCGEYYPVNRSNEVVTNYTYNRLVCDACIVDYQRCRCCEQYYENEDMFCFEDTEDLVCEVCAENLAICACCGRAYEFNHVNDTENGLICNDCMEEHKNEAI